MSKKLKNPPQVTVEEWEFQLRSLFGRNETLTKENGWLTVVELAELMDVNRSTTRRRLNLLLAEGKVEEMHGIRKQINGVFRKTPVYKLKK